MVPNYVYTYEAESPYALCAHVESSRNTKGNYPRLGTENQHGDSGEDWGGKPLQTFIDLVRIGEAGSSGVALIEQLVADLVDTLPPLPTVKRVRTRDRQGSQLRLHSLLRGDLRQSWVRTRRQARMQHDPLVTLCICGSYSSYTSLKAVTWSTAATLALAYTLEQAGWRVGLVSVQCAQGAYREGDVMTTCWLKHHQDPWNMQEVALTMRPEWLRRLGFRLWEMGQPALHLEDNYGKPSVWPTWTSRWAQDQGWPHPLLGCTPHLDQVENATAARQWIMTQLTTLGAAA